MPAAFGRAEAGGAGRPAASWHRHGKDGSAKAQLARSLGLAPATDLHFLAVDVHGAHGKVDADGVLLLLVELPRLEAVHHARLPHVGVADQDDLEEVVEGIVRAGAGERHRGCRAGLRPGGGGGGGAAGPRKKPGARRSPAGAALPGQVAPP